MDEAGGTQLLARLCPISWVREPGEMPMMLWSALPLRLQEGLVELLRGSSSKNGWPIRTSPGRRELYTSLPSKGREHNTWSTQRRHFRCASPPQPHNCGRHEVKTGIP